MVAQEICQYLSLRVLQNHSIQHSGLFTITNYTRETSYIFQPGFGQMCQIHFTKKIFAKCILYIFAHNHLYFNVIVCVSLQL